MNYYTVYDNASDTIVVCGNAVKCSKYLGIKPSSFYYAISRQKKQDSKHRYTIVVEKINDKQM